MDVGEGCWDMMSVYRCRNCGARQDAEVGGAILFYRCLVCDETSWDSERFVMVPGEEDKGMWVGIDRQVVE